MAICQKKVSYRAAFLKKNHSEGNEYFSSKSVYATIETDYRH